MVAIERSRASHIPRAACPSRTRTLREGDRADDVRALQRQLNARGAQLDVDGVFGVRMAAAVDGFQRSHGLDANGVAGPRTMAKLGAGRAGQGDLLKRGDRGRDVLAAERKLHKLGYDTGRVDGVFDAKTVKVVRAFKGDESGRDRTGRLGDAGQAALSRASSSWDHAPLRGRVMKNHGARRRLDALTATQATAPRADGKVGLGEGDAGRDSARAICNVQAHLGSVGYGVGKVDGVFDGRTTAAVQRFQRKSGLPVTGRVDPPTWQALQRTQRLATSSTSPAQRVGEQSAAVRHTERQLSKLGYDVGRVDGRFDGVGAGTPRAIDKAVRDGGVVRPIAARLTSTSEFGYTGADGAPADNGVRHHAGRDWFAPGGATVRSPVSGKVVEVRPSRGNSGHLKRFL
ncbi:MAG: hypothetical protein FJ137_02915 [Deltaproteobacteria bacterium]|nr:hypothetical protein [Deltaproteobacteria bacterium]